MAATVAPYAMGCSSEAEEAAVDPDDEGELPGPSRGSAVVLSSDDRVAVMVNRDVGTVSVFELTYPQDGCSFDGKDSFLPTVTKKAEIDLGAGSEPWQVVISPNATKAYVVLRKSQQVVRIVGLRGKPREDGRVDVGSEPTGIAMTPSGRRLFVANWVDGTLSEIDAIRMQAKGTIDLNAELAKTGLLGNVEGRPGLAHPRSVAITSNLNRNDNDESVLVTEYFAQRTAPLAADGSNADTSLQGVVYKLNLWDRSVKVIPLAPLADIGFKDVANNAAGCFPNQLQSVTIAGSYAYVSSICASPKGPLGVFTGPANPTCAQDIDCPGAGVGSCNLTTKKCATNCTEDLQCGANGGKCNANVCAPNVAGVKTTTAPVVSVIDIEKGVEIPAATASMNAQFNALYTQKGTADDGSRKFPSVTTDIGFLPKPVFQEGKKQIGETAGGSAYMASNASDAIFRANYDLGKGSAIKGVGSDQNNFIDLNPAGIAPEASGKNPVGIAIGYTGRNFALVANDVSRNLTVVDLKTQTIAQTKDAKPNVVSAAALPAKGSPEDHKLKGKRFFNTGTARWSLKGQGWGACQSCHMDGLTDNVSWFFARGPRQSTSLDGSFSKKNPADQRIFNWSAIFDEVDDFELNTRGVQGGVGAIVSALSAPPVAADRIDIAALGHAGLAGSSAQASDPTNPAGLPAAGKLTDWSEITEYMKGIRAPRGSKAVDAAKVEKGKALFAEGNCAGCHGGDKWTISSLFYKPSKDATAAAAAKAWTPPTGFPVSLLPATTPANQLMRFPATNGNLDQLQCILRPVGTFGANDGRTGAAELRADMKTPAQGNEVDGKGYNPPSLFSVSIGAPYLHNGGAQTLESLFSDGFKPHHTALSTGFLDGWDRKEKVDALVSFLLSIDDETPTYVVPAAGPAGGNFCAP